jgi:outer membrane protein OmpA-like peptidoglycan-associated protein
MPSKFRKKPMGTQNFGTTELYQKIGDENLSKVVSKTFFIIGVFSFFSYFFYIDYFPSFDLNSAASYVLSLALVLIIITASLSMIFLSPYIMAATFIRAKRNKNIFVNRKLVTEIFHWMISGMLSMLGIVACVFYSTHQELPTETGILASFLMLLLLSSIRASLIRHRKSRGTKAIPLKTQNLSWLSIRRKNFLIAIFRKKNKEIVLGDKSVPSNTLLLPRRRVFVRQIGALIFLIYRRTILTTAARRWQRRQVRHIIWTQWFGTFLMGMAQMAPIAMLLLTLDRASEIDHEDYSSYINVALVYAVWPAISGGFLLYLALTPAYRRNWQWGVAIVLILPLWLSMFSQASGMLPMTVMQITKNGNFRAEKMIFSAKSCSTIAPILEIACDPASTTPIELCNVHVMSRVGSETYLRLLGNKLDKNGIAHIERVFIPTSEIAAMSVDFNLKFLSLKNLDANLATMQSKCDKEIIILEGDSSFAFNSAKLTNQGETDLIHFSKSILNMSETIDKIIVTGHSDLIGEKDYNLQLSTRRAAEVTRFIQRELKTIGLKVSISSESKGDGNPIVTTCSEEKDPVKCEAANRRVEIRVIKKKIASNKILKEI